MNDRIKKIRMSLGLSQDEFGRRLGVTRGAVTNIELNKVEPKPLFIGLICREFGVNEVWLRTGEGEMFTLRDTAEEITDYTAKILVDKDAALQRRIVSFMSRIPPDCWKVLEEKAKEIFAEDGEEAQE